MPLSGNTANAKPLDPLASGFLGWSRFVRDLIVSPLVAATLITIILFLATAITVAHNGQERARREEKVLLETFALSLSEHIKQAINRGDDLLVQIRDAYLRDPKHIKDVLEAHNRTVDRSVFPLEALMDAQGIMIASNADTRIPTPRVDLSDREHFRVHKEASDPTKDPIFFSKVVVGRVSGKAVLQITRGMRSAAGEFLGVAVVSLNPEEFVNPYRRMGGADSIIAIIGFDRVGRLRVSHDKTDYSVDYSKSTGIDEMISRNSGTLEITSVADGVQRIYAYRHIEGLPLLVSVGSSTREVQNMSSAFFFGNLPTISLMVGASLLGLLGLAIWSRILMLRLMRSNEALAGTMREMAMANSAQRHFIATISHELRTPLHGILGHAEILSLDSPPGPLRESADAIFKSAGDLRSMVTQLLDMARVEAGKEVLHLEPVNVAMIIDEVSQLHRAAATHADLSFTVDTSAVRNLVIVSDSIALKRCLHNLLSNAVKFTARGGITVTATADDSARVRISVADTGVGIAAENIDKVFDYYSYLSQVANRNAAGTGLGLALCRKLIEMLGGRLWVESSPGEGSVFHIELPPSTPTVAGQPSRGTGPSGKDEH